jgi:hypothetical protein
LFSEIEVATLKPDTAEAADAGVSRPDIVKMVRWGGVDQD